MDLLPLLVFFSLLFQAVYSIKLTARDLPKFKHPCAWDNPKRETQCIGKRKFGTSEGFAFNKIGRYNNFFCKVYGMCIGLTTGTMFLTAQAIWRSKGILPKVTRRFPYSDIHDIVKHWHNSKAWKPYEQAKKEKAEKARIEAAEKEKEEKAKEDKKQIEEEEIEKDEEE